MTIPAGIDEGHQIRLSNEGETGPRGGAPGSLYVAVHVADHPSLTREGTELFYEADISIVQAALGTRIHVPTVEGDDTELDIKAGTQPGRRSGSAAGECPTCGASRCAATFTSWSTSSCRRRCRSASASCWRHTRRRRARASRRAAACARSWGSDEPATRRSRRGRVAGPARGPRPRRRCGHTRRLARAVGHRGPRGRGGRLRDPSRAAPGGTSVEPAFELVEDGLAARVDFARPAMVRAHLPILDVAAIRAAVARADRELGHLQAFGMRPIGDLAAAIVLEADWANAWKAHFPVLRIGRRIVIRPTWRRHRRQPDDVVLALDPGMAFGTGLHPTTRLCLSALESLADRGVLEHGANDGGPARVLDVGSGSGILSIAAAKLGAARCSPWTWTRSRSRRVRPTRVATVSRPSSASGRGARPAARARSTSSSRTSSRRC